MSLAVPIIYLHCQDYHRSYYLFVREHGNGFPFSCKVVLSCEKRSCWNH